MPVNYKPDIIVLLQPTSPLRTAEDIDLVWKTTNIGTKDEDHRSLYGIIIKDPKTNNAIDKVDLEMPEEQVKAEIEITRQKSSVTKTDISKTTILGEQIPEPVLASEVKLKEDYNLILVGGPCANPRLNEFKVFPTCENWPLKEGEAMIRFAKNKNNIAMLVAGTTAEDTRMATRFLMSYKDDKKLEGTYIKIKDSVPESIYNSSEGIDFSDYPYPFIKDGKMQNVLLVVGDNALGDDTIGAEDIASNLLLITRRATKFANLTEDLNSSNSLKKEIPLGNKLADPTFFNRLLTSSNNFSINYFFDKK